jgi:hypothetical protein
MTVLLPVLLVLIFSGCARPESEPTEKTGKIRMAHTMAGDYPDMQGPMKPEHVLKLFSDLSSIHP